MNLKNLKKKFKLKYGCELKFTNLMHVKFFLAYYIHLLLNKIDFLRIYNFRKKINEYF